MSVPIITPKQFLAKDVLPLKARGCTFAIIGFCKFDAMKLKLMLEQLTESIFSHLDQSHQFIGKIGRHKILALECLYGGPLSATVLEELTHYGIKTIIGYGYAGSLKRQLPISQNMLANEAIVSDGTSREYLLEDEKVFPDSILVRDLNESARELGKPLQMGTVWTTDAIYREYPDKIEKWRETGADAVNMDTSYFYAVSSVVGISSVYVCTISDCVDGQDWDDGFGQISNSMADLQDVIIKASGKILDY
jgi:purine-nucleoside phosphorylase